jgi:hypothetical protein
MLLAPKCSPEAGHLSFLKEGNKKTTPLITKRSSPIDWMIKKKLLR